MALAEATSALKLSLATHDLSDKVSRHFTRSETLTTASVT